MNTSASNFRGKADGIRAQNCRDSHPRGFFACTILGTVLVFAGNRSAAATGDKGQFNLLRPTPAELLRDMATDRPDKTESPYTVDAGHFQIEMDLFNYTHDHDTAGAADTRADSYSIVPFNLKAGLFNNADFQILFETFTHERVVDRIAGSSATRSGFGDLTTRLKINLWGDDGGSTAFAVMPFLKFPTHRHHFGNEGVEGGLIFPLAVSLPYEWSMGLMTEFDFTRAPAGSGVHGEFINSITFGHVIYGELGGYLEFFSLVSTEKNSHWIGTVDVGLTYALTENIQLDAGVNLGVTSAADDINSFTGFSIRF